MDHRAMPLSFSRRGVLAGLIFSPIAAYANDKDLLLQKCKSALLTTAGMCFEYLLDDDGSSTSIDSDDKEWLNKNIFTPFTDNLSPLLTWIASSKFVINEINTGNLRFFLPHSADSGLPFRSILQARIDAIPDMSLNSSIRKVPQVYTFPKPKLLAGPVAFNGRVTCQVNTDEVDQIATFVPSASDGDQTATVMVSAGAIRKILFSSVYAYDIAPRKMSLWGSLSLSMHDNVITAQGPHAQYAISLLPLLRTPDPALYGSSFPPETPKSAKARFLYVYRAFRSLNDKGTLPSDVDLITLDRDIDMLNVVNSIFFNTMFWVLSHEVSHAIYRHQLPTDACTGVMKTSTTSHEHELAADESATIALFISTVTNTLNTQRTWVADWRPDALTSDVLASKLAWFDHMASIGVACNVAMPLLHAQANCFYPGYTERWARNVEVWNACVLAFSQISQYPAA